jgi:hypothetical protein
MSIINREPKAGKARATIEPVEAVEAIGIWKPLTTLIKVWPVIILTVRRMPKEEILVR